LPLQLYLCIAVVSHMAPSGRDLISGLRGTALLIAILALGALASAWAGLSVVVVLAGLGPLLLLVALSSAFHGVYVGVVALATLTGGRRTAF